MNEIPAQTRPKRTPWLAIIVIVFIALGVAAFYGYRTMNVSPDHSVTNVSPASVFPHLTFRVPSDLSTKSSTSAITEKPVQKPIWQIPILMYHYVRTVDPNVDNLGFRLSVTHDQFNEQMDWLLNQGYHTISPDQLLQNKALPAKSVLITFDDGYEDFYTDAWPILQAHNFTAMFFVVTGFMRTDGYVTPAQVTELSSQGAIIGAHTISHVNLNTQTPVNLQKQLVTPKTTLQKLIGKSVPYMAYPSGDYNDTVLAATAAAG